MLSAGNRFMRRLGQGLSIKVDTRQSRFKLANISSMSVDMLSGIHFERASFNGLKHGAGPVSGVGQAAKWISIPGQFQFRLIGLNASTHRTMEIRRMAFEPRSSGALRWEIPTGRRQLRERLDWNPSYEREAGPKRHPTPFSGPYDVAGTRNDRPDERRIFAAFLQQAHGEVGVRRPADGDEADAHVKRAEHLFVGNLA